MDNIIKTTLRILIIGVVSLGTLACGGPDEELDTNTENLYFADVDALPGQTGSRPFCKFKLTSETCACDARSDGLGVVGSVEDRKNGCRSNRVELAPSEDYCFRDRNDDGRGDFETERCGTIE